MLAMKIEKENVYRIKTNKTFKYLYREIYIHKKSRNVRWSGVVPRLLE